jgi:hypothetical protein
MRKRRKKIFEEEHKAKPWNKLPNFFQDEEKE